MPETFTYTFTVNCTQDQRSLIAQYLEREIRAILAEIGGNGMRIGLDYKVDPKPHWIDKPHQALALILSKYKPEFTERLASYGEYLGAMRADTSLVWDNPWFSGMDAVMAYMMIAKHCPKRVIEIGSGFSTTFMAAAKRHHSPKTHLTSIDPQPRAEIDQLCDEVVRRPFEITDLAIFDTLEAGDIMFIDSSHRVFTNSDVTTQFLDVIPYLKPGVFIHVHDVFLPRDYPVDMNVHFYSEQYLLAAFLLGGRDCVIPYMANCYVAENGMLPEQLKSYRGGSSFWLQKT